MEENNFTTTNLGNLNMNTGIPSSIPVAPVSDISNNIVAPVVETPLAQVANPVVTSEPVVETPVTPVQEATVNNVIAPVSKEETELIVNTLTLRSMLANTSKAVGYDNRLEISTIVQLVFSQRGLEVKVSNGAESYLYQRNTERLYSALGEQSMCFPSGLLKNLVDKITLPEIIFKRSTTNTSVITLLSGDNTYNISEKTDSYSGESINIEPPIDFTGASTINLVNKAKFKEAIVKCLPFTTKSDGQGLFKGIYCSKDYIVATNASSICITDSIPELADLKLFIPTELASTIIALNASGEAQLSYSITDDRKYPSMMQIHSIDPENNSEILLMGMLQADEFYEQFPVETVSGFTQIQFDDAVEVAKTPFIEAVERTKLFFEMQDRNQLIISTTSKILNIKNLSGGSDERVLITSTNNSIINANLDATQLSLVLNSNTGDTVKLQASEAAPGLICIRDDNNIMILSEIGQ